MSDPVRLGFLSTVHPHPWAPQKGTFNRTMLASLLGNGVSVRAIVPVPWTERRGSMSIPATPYPVEFPTFRFLPRVAPLALARQLEWSTAAARRQLAQQVNLIMGYWTDPDGTVAANWAQRAGLPFVQMVGGSDVLVLGEHPARGARMLATLRRAQLVLTIGSGLRHELVRRGVASERIRTFRRGVDRSVFSSGDKFAARASHLLPADRPILLWAGRMVPVKGLDILFDALALPILKTIDPLLILIGDGPLEPHLRNRAQREGLSGVIFASRQPQDTLASWYRAADLVVLPSLSEGIPNVLAEALACGTGFVASDVGSVKELGNDPSAELVPAGDPVALAERIAGRLLHPAAELQEVPDVAASGRELAAMLSELV